MVSGFMNLKIRSKLLLAFSLVLALAIVIGVVGVVCLNKLHVGDEAMYNDNTLALEEGAVLFDMLATERICLSNAVIFYEADPQFSQDELQALQEKEQGFATAMSNLKSKVSSTEEVRAYQAIESLYAGTFAQAKAGVIAAIATGNAATMADAIKAMDDAGASVSDEVDALFAENVKLAEATVKANEALFNSSSTVIMAVLLLCVALTIVLALLIAKAICAPLGRMLGLMKQVGEQGDFEFAPEVVEKVFSDAQRKDETGQMSDVFGKMMDSLIAKTKVLNTVADGDLSAEVQVIGAKDTIGNAVKKMVDNLNRMFSDINMAAQQTAAGSSQIATGAQALAQATTEQAATVEMLSRSVGDIAVKTEENADMAEKAAALGNTVKERAEEGSRQMDELTSAVREINEASRSISTVIKVIDDIAFQTNILALNAAVEAARAGQHGKGFAVVAEEVRNLAGKSAEAAKNTSTLIENSLEKADLGARIAVETAESLAKIVEGINENSRIVGEISHSSEDQSVAVAQINNGIDQLTQVVQQNSATAEESAAASEEMNSQINVLRELVEQFTLREGLLQA